jgi:type I restriction enzyme S subunit
MRPVFANWLIGSDFGKSYFLKAAKQTTGTASINKSQLSRFPLLLPPVDVQIAFEKELRRANDLSLKATSGLKQMDSLFSSLQHRAFSGDL